MATSTDGGITRRLRRIGSAFVDAIQLRSELVSLELRYERSRVVGLLFQAVLAALLLFMAFLCFNVVALLYWWDQRVVVASGLGGLYLVAAIVIGLVLRHRLRHDPAPLAGTIEELRKDAVALSSKG